MSVSTAPQAGPTPWLQQTIHALDEITSVIVGILDSMASAGFTERDCFGMRLSLEESIVNGIKHGNRSDVNKAVHIRFALFNNEVQVEIEDQGPGFNPDAIPDPLAPENIERPGGRGVFLMRHYMTWVRFNDRGNCVTLCKQQK